MVLSSGFDEFAVERELADEGIDLPQAQGQLEIPFQVAADEAVGRDAAFQGQSAGIICRSRAVLLGQRKQTQDAPDGGLTLRAVQGLAKRPDVWSGDFGAAEQLLGRERGLLGPVLLFNTVAAARVAQVFP